MRKKISLVLGSSLLCMALALPNVSLAVFEDDKIEDKGLDVLAVTRAYQGTLQVESRAHSVATRQAAAKQTLSDSIEELIKYARAETGLSPDGSAWADTVKASRIAVYSKQKTNLQWLHDQLRGDSYAQEIIGVVLERVQNVIDFWNRTPSKTPPTAGSIFGRVSPDEWPAYEGIVRFLREGNAALKALDDKALTPIKASKGDLDEGQVGKFFPNRFISEIFYMSRTHAIKDEAQDLLFRGLYGYISSTLRESIQQGADDAVHAAKRDTRLVLDQFQRLLTVFGQVRYRSEREAANFDVVRKSYVELFLLPTQEQQRGVDAFGKRLGAYVDDLDHALQEASQAYQERERALEADLRELEERISARQKQIEDDFNGQIAVARAEAAAADQRTKLQQELEALQREFEELPSAPTASSETDSSPVDEYAARRAELPGQIEALKQQVSQTPSVDSSRISELESQRSEALSRLSGDRSQAEQDLRSHANLSILESEVQKAQQAFEDATRSSAFQQQLLTALLDRGVEALVDDGDAEGDEEDFEQ